MHRACKQVQRERREKKEFKKMKKGMKRERARERGIKKARGSLGDRNAVFYTAARRGRGDGRLKEREGMNRRQS